MKQLSLINFALAAATGGAGGGMTPEERQDLQDLKKKVADLETSKDLGVVVVGSPQIHGSQISAFSADNYLMMPRIIEFGNSHWQLDFQFTTGADVQAQQNIIDSAFGLALAIAQGKLEIALSSNGTSWNLGAHFGTKVLAPNTSYFVRMTFDGSKYVVAVSTDRKTYTADITVGSTASLYPVQIYIGKSPNNAHIFGGSIYLYYAALSINDEIVWTGTLGGELKDELRNLETTVSKKVASVNGKAPDANGNIDVDFGNANDIEVASTHPEDISPDGAAIVVREANRMGEGSGTVYNSQAPRIGFNWKGRWWAQILMVSNVFKFVRGKNDTQWAGIQAGTIQGTNIKTTSGVDLDDVSDRVNSVAQQVGDINTILTEIVG